ncbi:MAG TPA: hypothetical protein VG944_06310 [Fimbriimonas sp.]|nr:hypothetical protein [Fimbriimonas sp.]
MRFFWAACFLVTAAWGQVPDVRIKFDLIGSYYNLPTGPQTLKLYDPLGDASAVQLSFSLEPGLRAFVSERLQAIPNDPSRDPFEQYYVEDEGIWRLGKQYLPFGSGRLIRENVLAARGETNLLFENLNIVAAICDGGPGAQRGIVGRIGNRLGFSFALGQHFGISPTSLDVVRNPESSPGVGRGWNQMVGLDGSKSSGRFLTEGEIVWLHGPDSAQDSDLAISDLGEVYHFDKTHSLEAGWSRRLSDRLDVYRLLVNVPIDKRSTIVPMIRFHDGRLFDFSVTVRARF